MAKRTKPIDWHDPAWQQKQRIWRHNAFSGHAAMMRSQARAIHSSDSANETAKRIAMEIHRLAEELSLALKERIDP